MTMRFTECSLFNLFNYPVLILNCSCTSCIRPVPSRRCPTYISDAVQSIKMASTRGGLHSAESTDYFYVLPQLHTKFAKRAFCYAGPTSWNHRPARVHPQNVVSGSLKRQLKIFFILWGF